MDLSNLGIGRGAYCNLVFSALGFASGYGVREWISRRHQAAAREALEIRYRLLARQ